MVTTYVAWNFPERRSVYGKLIMLILFAREVPDLLPFSKHYNHMDILTNKSFTVFAAA